MLVVTSCKKDENQNLAATTDAQAGTKTTKQLLAFRDNLKLKSSGSLPTDSATWYLEGLLNYENANNDHQFDGLEFFKDSIIITTLGNSLSLNELNEAYLRFTNKLNLISQTKNDSNFTFDAISLTYEPSGLKNGEAKFAMVVSGGLNIVGAYLAFGPTDYWVWGLSLGKCGPYSGGTSNAALELEYRFNHPVIGIPSESGYYTEVETVYASGQEYPDPNNPGPYCDYKIFYFDAGNTGIWPCISPTELNYYLSTFSYVMNDKKPPLKTFINVSVDALFFPNYTNIYFYYYNLHYGIFHPHSGSGN